MKTSCLVTIFFIFIFSAAFGQDEVILEEFEDEVVGLYEDYYSVSRELVYTHFNKSSYLPGDGVWFTSYVLNPQTQRTSLKTSNLWVDLYDPSGALVEQKILSVREGVASSVFMLRHDALPGTYTYRASTLWMRNFEVDLEEIRPIQVLGAIEKQLIDTMSNIDLQFLPESGILLAGMTNRVGIRAVGADGLGVSIAGRVVDAAGIPVQTFELNSLGMGSITLFAEVGDVLHCEVPLADGSVRRFPLPEVQEHGVLVQVSQLRGKVFASVATNGQTLTKSQQFYIFMHSQGEVQRIALVRLNEERRSQLLEFDAEGLRGGVHCMTLFDEAFQPVAERLFFVCGDNLSGVVELEGATQRDTITLRVSTSKWAQPVEARLSISVLPGGTVSSTFASSLLIEAKLAGLHGHIENPYHYFDEENERRMLDMDDLMLTQGWRRYAWDRILAGEPLALEYAHEEGFAVAGRVEPWSERLSGKAMVSYALLGTGEVGFVSPDPTGRFEIQNLQFYDSTYLYLSVADEKGRAWNRKIGAEQYFPMLGSDTVEVSNWLRSDALSILPAPDMSLYPADIHIDEVRFVGKRVDPPKASDLYQAYEAKTFTITEENAERYRSVTDILRQEFSVSNIGEESAPVYKMNRGINSINLKGDPLIVIDDIPLMREYTNKYTSPAATLASMPISDIESITVNKTGFGMGLRGVEGVIMVKTRTKPLHAKSNAPPPTRVKLRGYAPPAEFYTPRYSVLPPDPVYTKYATVHWEPNLTTNDNGEATVRFPIPSRLKDIHVRVEGIGSDGTIFSETKVMNIN